jgi:hypothetical protein
VLTGNKNPVIIQGFADRSGVCKRESFCGSLKNTADKRGRLKANCQVLDKKTNAHEIEVKFTSIPFK